MVPLPKILASRLVEFFFSGVFALSNFLSCLYMVPLPKILASRLVEFFFWSFCPFQFFIVPIYGAIAENISETTCGVFFWGFCPFQFFIVPIYDAIANNISESTCGKSNCDCTQSSFRF